MKAQVVQLLLAAGLLAGCARPQPAEEATLAPSTNAHTYPLISPGAQFATLPPAVQNAVRAEVGSADIDRIVKGTNANGIVYEIYFQNKDLYPPLFVAQDGRVLNSTAALAQGAPTETTGVLSGGAAVRKPSELPANVQELIQERAPGAEVTHVTQETWGNRILYIVSLKDGRKLYITEDGIVLNETGSPRSN